MLEALKDKKFIFFDVGYTLDYPASGDWMFTKKFYRIVGDRLSKYSFLEIQKARELSLEYLEKNHLVKNTEKEYYQFIRFYPDAKEVLEVLSHSYKLGIISDTWPSIEQQLCAIGVRDYFSTSTYSCELGKFKPDEALYKDSLRKCGCKAEETVFIDDSVRNLEGALN